MGPLPHHHPVAKAIITGLLVCVMGSPVLTTTSYAQSATANARGLAQSASGAATAGPVSILQGTSLNELGYGLGNTMNFDSCLDFKVEACRGKCKGIPVPGIRFKYKEPTALVEVSCRHGKSELNKNSFFVSSMLSGSLKAPDMQSCVTPIKTDNGNYTRWYFDVHAFGITPLARYKSSGSTRQATLSLTCGIFGMAGYAMDLSAAAQGFSLSSLNPANIAKNIGSGIQNSIQNIANMPQNLMNQAQSAIKNIASIPANLGQQLSGLQSSLSNGLSGLSSGNLTNMAGNLGKLGENLSSMGSLPIPGASSLGMAGQMLGAASTGYTQLASGLANPGAIVSQVQENVNMALTGVRDFVAASASGVNSAVSTLSGVSLSGGGSASAFTDDLNQAIQVADNVYGGIMSDANGGGLFQLAQVRSGTSTYNTLGSTSDYSTSTKARDLPVPGFDRDTQRLIDEYGMPKADTGDSAPSNEEITEFNIQGDWQSGSSQSALQTAQALYYRMQETFGNGTAFQLAEARKAAREPVTAGSAHCAMLEHLLESRQNLRSIQASLPGYFDGTQPDKGPRNGPFIAQATYLAGDLLQQVFPGNESASCPLTHAGIVYQASPGTRQGYTTERANCRYHCGEGGREGNRIDCKWVPKTGFGGNCDYNVISKVKVSGLYPSCNGVSPKLVANDDGVMMTSRSVYRPAQDHVRRLNTGFLNSLTTASRQGAANLETAIAVMQPLAEKTPGGCAAANVKSLPAQSHNGAEQSIALVTGKLFGTAQYGAEGAAPSDNLLISKDTSAYIANARKGLGGADINSAAGMAEVKASLDTIDSLMQKGGMQQMGANLVGKYAPFGLVPAFMSENTLWAQPPVGIKSTVMTALGVATANSPAYLACSAPQIMADYGADANMQSFSKDYCVGMWGLMEPKTGWAHNELQPVAAALIGARGHAQGVALKGIQPNTKGTQQFNLDYPFIHAKSPFAQSAGFQWAEKTGKHKGSKCNDVGTSTQSWFNGGEKSSLDPSSYVSGLNSGANSKLAADLQKGYYVFTYWKRTSCCVTPCDVKREY